MPGLQQNERGSANDRQVAGNHYKNRKGQQHWDRAWDLYREAWFVLNITKYVERYREKGGLTDLLKAQHYLDKLIELERTDLKLIEKVIEKKSGVVMSHIEEEILHGQ